MFQRAMNQLKIWAGVRSEEHTSELQSQSNIVCRLLLEKKSHVVKEISAPATQEMAQAMSIAHPRLWSPDEPVLYTLETELRRGKVVLDQAVNSFGVRIV